ncbi:hypothetical protein PSCFBP3800_05691 [Pseudomonas syringae group genomosp. 3]|uniref:Uncharacterized protein n=1 Tax=Pseudomonas amygdali pv. morsprunorum TaxID=129138 RepID=A0A3M2X126_PSEA0|nr:hypothetical protein ALQ94_200153 [Pseudomonas amygdali pv. morsprunorum]SPF21134.1 hypothetical protein PSCFBP3800_05691 [Pseudomonas syringae group genomosp. 3]
MIIDALYESDRSLYRYDTDTGRLLFSQSPHLLEKLSGEKIDTRSKVMAAGAIYESERSKTRYSNLGKMLINQQMRTQAYLFGKPRLRSSPPLKEVSNSSLRWLVLESIRFVFRNNSATPWAINDLGPGVRRVYPSNGAVHSLECCYIDDQGRRFVYDSYNDCFFLVPHPDLSDVPLGSLIIQCDFERLAERYRDVRSLSALYIELGHSIAALFYALQTRGVEPTALQLSTFKPAMEYYCSVVGVITL